VRGLYKKTCIKCGKLHFILKIYVLQSKEVFVIIPLLRLISYCTFATF